MQPNLLQLWHARQWHGLNILLQCGGYWANGVGALCRHVITQCMIVMTVDDYPLYLHCPFYFLSGRHRSCTGHSEVPISDKSSFWTVMIVLSPHSDMWARTHTHTQTDPGSYVHHYGHPSRVLWGGAMVWSMFTYMVHTSLHQNGTKNAIPPADNTKLPTLRKYCQTRYIKTDPTRPSTTMGTPQAYSEGVIWNSLMALSTPPNTLVNSQKSILFTDFICNTIIASR
jgi:hypothetical protein